MLLRVLWDGLRSLLDSVFALLPSGALPFPDLEVALQIPWPFWLPYQPLMTAGAVTVVWIGLLGVYEIFSWVWRHIPTIAGFGTGSG